MKKEVLEKLNLGGKIKELRLQKGMTLKDLAERTGFSPALLSQVENNLVSPSISTLWNFAEALGVKIGYFFHQEGVEHKDYVVTRAGKEALVYRNELPHTLPYRDLAYGYEDRSMSPFLLFCDEPCEFSLKEITYEGEEFLHVMEGAIEVEYAGKTFRLEPGDSIYYSAQLPHRIRVPARARFLAVLYEAHRH